MRLETRRRAARPFTGGSVPQPPRRVQGLRRGETLKSDEIQPPAYPLARATPARAGVEGTSLTPYSAANGASSGIPLDLGLSTGATAARATAVVSLRLDFGHTLVPDRRAARGQSVLSFERAHRRASGVADTTSLLPVGWRPGACPARPNAGPRDSGYTRWPALEIETYDDESPSPLQRSPYLILPPGPQAESSS